MQPDDRAATAADDGARRRFGYPDWFVTLFLTDIWERFSFYGMAAVLTLYAASPAAEGGLGLPPSSAAALFGSYLGLVFLLALPGGWLGDRVLGTRRATLYGCVLIAFGHYGMAVPARWTSYLGLVLIAAGTGLLKPNMAALLSSGYRPEEHVRRQAAFSIFYVSIQVSALIAPLVVGALSEILGWHWGFAAAGVGMTFGVVQFARGSGHFGDRGVAPGHPAPVALRQAVGRRTAAFLGVAGVLAAVDVLAGTFTEMHVIAAIGLCAVVVPFVCFVAVVRDRTLGAAPRRRLLPFFWLLLSYATFWLLAAQSGSMLNLFAREHTARSVAGVVLPASWFQSVIPLFILLTAPFFAWLWPRLGDRFGVPAKFGLALGFVGAAFIVMSRAAALAVEGPVSPLWLIAAFLLVACGEVVIGPVGISTAAEVVDSTRSGRTIGLLWLFSGFGAGLGSQVVHLSDLWSDRLYYLVLGLFAVGVGIAVVRCRRVLGRVAVTG
ncbi:peptide MFS transporter [Actinosynnema sp. CS-041913]|uniref:peptide MFS transporter n=1 Tax=Actinosynnema sp. CS-041913 TaxID=3239917 RepID=UPI003D8E0948